MLKNFIYLSTLFFTFLGFSQKIKTITELNKIEDSLVKVRETTFDNFGNLIKEITYGGYDAVLNTKRNYNKFVNYKNGQRTFEYDCEDFVSMDTCVVRSFSNFEFNPKTKTEIETKYEADSLIRFIREIKIEKNSRISTTKSWEFFPVKVPNFETAAVLTDTMYFDKKDRIIKRVTFNSDFKNEVVEVYKYSSKGYSRQIIGNSGIRAMNIIYSEIQKIINKNNLKYRYESNDKYLYEIEYY